MRIFLRIDDKMKKSIDVIIGIILVFGSVLLIFVVSCEDSTSKTCPECPSQLNFKCPTEVSCPSGTFKGDDGICYSCDTEQKVDVYCIGETEALKSCPNRFIEKTSYTCSKDLISSRECYKDLTCKKDCWSLPHLLNPFERVSCIYNSYIYDGNTFIECNGHTYEIDYNKHICKEYY